MLPGDKPPTSGGLLRAVAERSPASSQRSPGGGEPEIPLSLTDFALEVYRALNQHLSQPNCRAIMAACAASAGVTPAGLKPDHLPFIAAQVERTFVVFGVAPDVKERCLAQLRLAAGRAELRSETSVPIAKEGDVVTARNTGKDLCRDLGFPEVAYVKVATAISELARNILKYAGKGQIAIRRLAGGEREGIEVVATDQGPGIADIEAVLSPKYRSKSGMGVGLRGTQRLMDHFEIKSQAGSGTTVVIRKYKE